MKTFVSVIIINYNGRKWLDTCLQSVSKQSYRNIEILVWDNASVDDSVQYIKRKFPKVTVLRSEKNLGFAQANNLAFKRAKGEFVLLLNTDTKLEKNTISTLVKVMEGDKAIGVAQPTICFLGDENRIQSIGSSLTITGFLRHHGYGMNPVAIHETEPREIFSANGSCMMVRSRVVKEISLFDPDYFAYFEESDFCWRVWLAGYSIVWVPFEKIYHATGGTSHELPSAFVDYHSFKNRINSLLKNLGFGRFMIVVPIHISICIVVGLYYALTGKFKNSAAIWKALWWNLRVLPTTIRKRAYIQRSIRKISDNELWAKIATPFSFSYFLNFFKAYVRRW